MVIGVDTAEMKRGYWSGHGGDEAWLLEWTRRETSDCGHESWLLEWTREEHTLRIFENKALRKTRAFGTGTEGVAGEWRVMISAQIGLHWRAMCDRCCVLDGKLKEDQGV